MVVLNFDVYIPCPTVVVSTVFPKQSIVMFSALTVIPFAESTVNPSVMLYSVFPQIKVAGKEDIVCTASTHRTLWLYSVHGCQSTPYNGKL